MTISGIDESRADQAERTEPLRFERRQEDRWQVGGIATAFELAGEGFGRMHTVTMSDYSDSGVGGQSETVIPPGTFVSLGFQNPGYSARRGIVTRCRPRGAGYEVAVIFEGRLAA